MKKEIHPTSRPGGQQEEPVLSCPVAFSRNNDGRMQPVIANQKPWDGDRPELGWARGAIESDGDCAESGVHESRQS